MSKVLPATCLNGVVTVDDTEIDGVEILSEGIAASEGILILEEFFKVYVTRSSTDLKSALTTSAQAFNLAGDALTKVSGLFSSLGVLPPALAPLIADITQVYARAATLNTLKENLK